MTHRVFVYGTLKRNNGNHHLLRTGAEFIGIAYTVDPFKMYTVGFPVIRPDPDGKTVAGEVYDVDDQCLKRLDSLEAEGVMYDRVKTGVIFPSTTMQMEQVDEAFIYVGRPEYWEHKNPPPFTNVNLAGELEWL